MILEIDLFKSIAVERWIFVDLYLVLAIVCLRIRRFLLSAFYLGFWSLFWILTGSCENGFEKLLDMVEKIEQ